MRRRLAARLCLCLAALLPALRARALDPRHEYRTLLTPHFRIHFPDGGYRFALRAARALEEAHRLLVPHLGHVPWRPTEVVLTDDTDSANGSATATFRPLIRGFMAPPEATSSLGHYDDFVWLLMLHEYVHILHLDTTSDLPWLGNQIFGHVFAPNGVQPLWVVEGLATYYESRLTGGGRNDSPFVDMFLRAQVAEGGLWNADRISTASPVQWPGGHGRYFYGGRLLAEITARHGPAAPFRMSHDYGGRALPYAVNVSTAAALGEPMQPLFEAWRDAETQRHRRTLDEIEAAGIVEGRRLTHLGREVHAPRWLDRAHLLFYADDGVRAPGLFALSLAGAKPSEPRRIHLHYAGGRFDVAQGIAVYQAVETVDRHQSHADLWAVDVAGGPALRLSYGLRARDPALDGAGRRLAFVASRRGISALYVAALRLEREGPGLPPRVVLGRPIRLFAAEGTEIDRPALSQDGRHLAVALHESRGRHIALFDLAGLTLPPPVVRIHPGATECLAAAPEACRLDPEPPDAGTVRRATPQRIDAGPWDASDPAFDPSGRWLYFTSARSGIYDLYAWPLAGGTLRRLTRVRTGAFEPRPAGDGRLLYVGYHAEGYDLYLLEGVDPAAAPPAEAPQRRAEPSFAPRNATLYPVVPYSPWPSLRPYHWIPLAGADASGLTLGAMSAGADLLGRHQWSAAAWLGIASGEPGYSAGYTYRGLSPTLRLYSGRSFDRVGPPVHVREGRRLPYFESSWRAGFEVTFPTPGIRRGKDLSLGFAVDHRAPRSVIAPFDPLEPTPRLPERGTVTRVSARWAISTVHGHAETTSATEGARLSLTARVASRLFGGDFDYVELFATATGFAALPWHPAHVLALRVQGGLGTGDFGGRRLFGVGGLRFDDPVRALIEGSRFGGATVRGFPPFVRLGDGYFAANLEYRFPLFTPDFGFDFLPFFIRQVHGALFADVGSAGDPPFDLDGPPAFGLGAELRVDIVLSYYLQVRLRAGYAVGFGEGAAPGPFLGFGGSF